MSKVTQFRVENLPAAPLANSIYYVKSNTGNPHYVDAYITDSAGVAHAVGNVSMINDLITTAFSTLQAGSMLDVLDIAARDAKVADLTAAGSNAMVLVRDATSDATVENGGAFYYFDADDQSFTKTSEFATMDLVTNWGDIVGTPTSTPAAIDAAVANSHTHANKAELDKFGEDAASGNPTYDSKELATTEDLTAAVNAGGAADAAQDTAIAALVAQEALTVAKDADQDAAIAALEADRHTHSNAATLDKITEDADGMVFDGTPVVSWEIEEW